MQYHKQILRHDPENGVMGDCFRTVLACLLDLEPEDVPHFMGDQSEPIKDAWAKVDEWLGDNYGLRFCSIRIQVSDIDPWLKFLDQENPGLRLELGGKSPRGSCHSVVAQGGKVLHDPHPDGGGIIGPCDEDECYSLGFLLPTKIHGKRNLNT